MLLDEVSRDGYMKCFVVKVVQLVKPFHTPTLLLYSVSLNFVRLGGIQDLLSIGSGLQ